MQKTANVDNRNRHAFIYVVSVNILKFLYDHACWKTTQENTKEKANRAKIDCVVLQYAWIYKTNLLWFLSVRFE